MEIVRQILVTVVQATPVMSATFSSGANWLKSKPTMQNPKSHPRLSGETTSPIRTVGKHTMKLKKKRNPGISYCKMKIPLSQLQFLTASRWNLSRHGPVVDILGCDGERAGTKGQRWHTASQTRFFNHAPLSVRLTGCALSSCHTPTAIMIYTAHPNATPLRYERSTRKLSTFTIITGAADWKREQRPRPQMEREARPKPGRGLEDRKRRPDNTRTQGAEEAK